MKHLTYVAPETPASVVEGFAVLEGVGIHLESEEGLAFWEHFGECYRRSNARDPVRRLLDTVTTLYAEVLPVVAPRPDEIVSLRPHETNSLQTSVECREFELTRLFEEHNIEGLLRIMRASPSRKNPRDN